MWLPCRTRTARTRNPRRTGSSAPRPPSSRRAPSISRGSWSLSCSVSTGDLRRSMGKTGGGRDRLHSSAQRNDPEATKMLSKVNLGQKLSLFSEHYRPKIVGELNGQYVKLVKFKGPFTWHHHDVEDEMFLVVKGRFKMELRDGDIWIEQGEFVIVPKGVEHRPVAEEEVHVLLFEPATTLNTGNVRNERTLEQLDRI